MGKRIIQQARGRGSFVYRVKKKAFKHKSKYPRILKGEGEVLKLVNSPGHSAPLAKINANKDFFYIPAPKGISEGDKISFEKNPKGNKPGDILKLKDIPLKTRIFQIESRPGDGGVFVKSAGDSAILNKIIGKNISVLMPSKKEKKLHPECRAIIGTIAGSGRLDKPIVKAGKKHHIKRSKGKLWPRTSAVKMNAVDHPFGSGRGKNPKSKIAKRDAPPGKKVGLLRPKRTGKKK